MAREYIYECSECKRSLPRRMLTAKKVLFKEVGSQSVQRSRITAWLCGSCLSNDPDYNLEPYVSPNDRSPSAGTR